MRRGRRWTYTSNETCEREEGCDDEVGEIHYEHRYLVDFWNIAEDQNWK